MIKFPISALLAAALVSSAASAEDAYLGGTVSKGGELTFRNPINGKADTQDSKATFKLYGGAAITDYLALEGGYAQAGGTHFDHAALGLPADPNFDISYLYAAARLSHQISEDWSIFGKAGLARSRFKASNGAGESDSVSSTKPLLAAGVAYNVTRAVALTLELEHIGATRQPGLNIKQDRLQLGVKVGF